MLEMQAFGKYGANVGSVGASAASDNAVTTGDAALSGHGLNNPMVVLFLVGAATLGLVAFSTSVRVGNVSASVSAGK